LEREGQQMTIESTEAAAALAAMRESRERLAAAADCPPARHLAFAGVLGGLVASQAAPPFATMAIEALLFAGVGLIVLWDRRRTGMFINGYRAGRTRMVTFGLLAFALVVMALTAWLKFERNMIWAPIVGGLVVAAAAYYGSIAWQRVYLRELRETP
jgi:DMSO/TMAO reductase YedYZ heme-binding membrane subunit